MGSLSLSLSLFFLAVPRSMRELSSPVRDQTRAPCSGSAESEPLDHQGIPSIFKVYKNWEVHHPSFHQTFSVCHYVSNTGQALGFCTEPRHPRLPFLPRDWLLFRPMAEEFTSL